MMHNKLKNQTLEEIVSSNYVFASILYYFGIRFFEYSEDTLGEVCRKNGIELESVLRELSKPELSRMEEAKLRKLPVDLLIEYLKHSHYIFAKKKLPYLAQLIQALQPEPGISSEVENDLKMVFPMFVEDFIQHLYMEEDTFFVYVMKLYKAVCGKAPVNPLFFESSLMISG